MTTTLMARFIWPHAWVSSARFHGPNLAHIQRGRQMLLHMWTISGARSSSFQEDSQNLPGSEIAWARFWPVESGCELSQEFYFIWEKHWN